MNRTVWFRFYEELNDFLPEKNRKREVPFIYYGTRSVKDAIEAQGVPHVEVELVMVNGVSVDFSYRLHDGDHISVYPVFESIDISGLICLRTKPLREPRFIADVHLGKLARYMRLCGFDTLYSPAYSDPEIVAAAEQEGRVILTRDRGILFNKRVTRGYWIRSFESAVQLREVIVRLDLIRQITPFTRCSECNSLLEDVTYEEIAHRLLPRTAEFFKKFWRCPECDKIYWAGSHYDRMKTLLDSIIIEAGKLH